MVHETLAAWAELDPNSGLMAVNELLALAGFSYPVASLFQ